MYSNGMFSTFLLDFYSVQFSQKINSVSFVNLKKNIAFNDEKHVENKGEINRTSKHI